MRLVIIRHAKANAHGPSGDISRELAPRGHAQAAEASEFLRTANIQPDHAIVSTAIRTTQTFEDLAIDCATLFEKSAYNASPATLAELIRKAPQDASCIAVVGHNPGVTELAMSCGYDKEMTTGSIVVVEWSGTPEDFGTADMTIVNSFTPTS